ncbi:hypothetical protein D3C78_1063270 [compost metagenome]
MGKDGMGQIDITGFKLAGQGQDMDLLGSLVSDQMGAQNLARSGIDNGFYETTMLADSQRLAIGLKSETSDTNVMAPLPCIALGHADTGYLWPGVDARGNQAAIKRPDTFNTSQMLDTDHCFMARLVREARGTGQIADGIKPNDIGTPPLIDTNEPSIELHPQTFEAEPFHIGLHTGRQQ